MKKKFRAVLIYFLVAVGTSNAYTYKLTPCQKFDAIGMQQLATELHAEDPMKFSGLAQTLKMLAETESRIQSLGGHGAQWPPGTLLLKRHAHLRDVVIKNIEELEQSAHPTLTQLLQFDGVLCEF